MLNEKLLREELKCNIINESNSKDIIEKVLNIISESVSKSLGPYGSTTIIQDPYSINHSVTKDGYSILNKISFYGGVETAILDLIRKISRSLVQEVGDASTSCIVVANKLLLELNKFFLSNTKVPRKEVLDFLNELEVIVEKEIKKISKPLKDKKRLAKVASISNNNDKELGNLVADIYEELGFKGFINLELSETENTYHNITNGVEVNRGYINYIYVTEPDKVTCKYKEPRILMCNDVLDDKDSEFIADLLTLSIASGVPMVIIAKEYSLEIANILNNNKVQNKKNLQLLPIEYSLATVNRNEEFQDLAVYLNATIYDKANGAQLTKKDAGDYWLNKMGGCKLVKANERLTQFIEGEINEDARQFRLDEIDRLAEAIKKKSATIDVSEELYELEKRKSSLEGKIASLYVGGKTDIEKTSRRDLLEDSIFACKSAIEYGYVIGGNLLVPHILYTKYDTIFEKLRKNKKIFNSLSKNNYQRDSVIYQLIDLTKESFLESYKRVLLNKYISEDDSTYKDILEQCSESKDMKIYNLVSNEFEDISKTDVINSANTDIAMMKSIFSIIGLLSSSNQLLALDNLYEY